MAIFIKEKEPKNQEIIVPSVSYVLEEFSTQENSNELDILVYFDDNKKTNGRTKEVMYSSDLPNDSTTTRSCTLKTHVRMVGGSVSLKNIVVVCWDANYNLIERKYNSVLNNSEQTFEFTRTDFKWGEFFSIRPQFSGYLKTKNTVCYVDATITLGEFTKTETVYPMVATKIGSNALKIYHGNDLISNT